MKVHRMRRCRFEVDEGARRARAVFEDGSELVAAPGHGLGDHRLRAGPGLSRSDEEAVWPMTRHHDLVHTLLAEAEGFAFSFTLHAVANAYEPPPGVCQREERIAFLIQRLLNVALAEVLADSTP